MSWKKPPSPLFIPPRPPSPHWGSHRLLLSIMARWEPLDTQVVKRLRLFSSYLFLWRLFSSYLFFWRLFSSYLFFWRLFSSYLFFWRNAFKTTLQLPILLTTSSIEIPSTSSWSGSSASRCRPMEKKNRIFCWIWWPHLKTNGKKE